MNWLFPLYLAGAAAIIAPILLHLRRRPPQDRVEFSSLLFLEAQTPVPVSKRRIENWLLLLLRCLALILLALMFSRPFVQSESTAAASPNSATLILLDRSASMRRADLWKQAIAEAEKLLKAAKLTDRIALAVFDRELTPLWSFEEDRNTPANRLTAIQTRLAALTPTWNATQLDRALIAAVPSFDSSTTSLKKRIHLISDLQEGTKLDALRTIAWPAELTLSVHRLDPASNDNLSIALAAREDDRSADALVRIRLSNTRDSALRDFTLAWQDAPKSDAITAQIPPGASRILTAPPNSTNATTLTLTPEAVGPVEYVEYRVVQTGSGGAEPALTRWFRTRSSSATSSGSTPPTVRSTRSGRSGSSETPLRAPARSCRRRISRGRSTRQRSLRPATITRRSRWASTSHGAGSVRVEWCGARGRGPTAT